MGHHGSPVFVLHRKSRKKSEKIGFPMTAAESGFQILKAERTPSPYDMNRQECRTKRIDSVCAVIWILLCARDVSVIKWGRGDGETLSIHVLWTRCALGLRLHPKKHRRKTFLMDIYPNNAELSFRPSAHRVHTT